MRIRLGKWDWKFGIGDWDWGLRLGIKNEDWV